MTIEEIREERRKLLLKGVIDEGNFERWDYLKMKEERM